MKKYTILCVDDQSVNLTILEEYLTKEDKFELFFASSAQEALKIILKNRIDIILLDIMMPDIDGFEMTDILRKTPSTKDIPIIFVTARDDESVVQEAFLHGGNDYVSKPIRINELIARINLQIKLLEKEEEIKYKQYLIEQMIDKQINMVIITDGKKLKNANHSFLHFVEFEDLESFNTTHQDILQYLLQFITVEFNNEIEKVFKPLLNEKAENILSVIADFHINQEIKTFQIDKICLGNGIDFMVTFTDVTSLNDEKVKFEHEATHDLLTGLYTRVMCNDSIDQNIQIAQRYGTTFSIVILDIDDFKIVNDTFGHLKGDDVLKAIANDLLKTRKSDIVCRWGGEEFMIVLPETSLSAALKVSETLRETIENDLSHGCQKVTASFGVTTYKGGDDLETLVKRADDALYEAKKTGKNKVVSL